RRRLAEQVGGLDDDDGDGSTARAPRQECVDRALVVQRRERDDERGRRNRRAVDVAPDRHRVGCITADAEQRLEQPVAREASARWWQPLCAAVEPGEADTVVGTEM